MEDGEQLWQSQSWQLVPEHYEKSINIFLIMKPPLE